MPDLLHQIVGEAVQLGDRVLDRVLRQRHRGHQRRRNVGERRLRLSADGFDSSAGPESQAATSDIAAASATNEANAVRALITASTLAGYRCHHGSNDCRRRRAATVRVGSTRSPGRGTTTSTPAGSAAASSRSMGSAHGCGASRNVAQWIGSRRPFTGFGDVEMGPHRLFGVHVDIRPRGVVGADRAAATCRTARDPCRSRRSSSCSRCRRRRTPGAADR